MSLPKLTYAFIEINFESYWLASTGSSGGGDADAPAFRDEDGFPAMPMTMIKGQLRETASLLYPEEDVADLFGSHSDNVSSEKANSPASILFIDNARLHEDDRETITSEEKSKLFRQLYSTQINERGVAEDKSLRTTEVCVPITLYGLIAANANAPDDWKAKISVICQATRSFGKNKTNGLGQAITKCVSVKEEVET